MTGWHQGVFCLSRRVLAGRFVLKIEKNLCAYLDGKILGGPFDTLEQAQAAAEEIVRGVFTRAHDEVASHS